MKLFAKLAIKVFVFLIGHSLVAQESIEKDTLSYQHVVACSGVLSDSLYAELATALLEIYDSGAVEMKGENIILVKVNSTVYNQLLGKLGNPAGVLDFLLAIEVKDEKFRASIDEFFFKPMKRDRYGRFHIVDKDSELVCEANFGAQHSVLKKIKEQSGNYIAKLEQQLSESATKKQKEKIEW